MTESLILVSAPEPGIKVISLNRSDKRNAMNPQLIKELMEALKKLATDPEADVVLITGNGEHFCAGADIHWMEEVSKSSHKENLHDATELALLLYTLYIFPKPTIALIHGMTMGGGLGLVAACDIAIGSAHSHYCFSEAKIGLTPSVISPYVIATLGERAARYYILTAKRFDADEALKIGLIQHLVHEEDLMTKGIEMAHELLHNSPHALAEAKKLITHVAPEQISASLIEYTAEHLASMRATQDAQEGLRAFLEKRQPKWHKILT